MCDTIVAVGAATADGSTLFAKNSDREPDEAQNIRVYPRAAHEAGDAVQCTYISVPQVKQTWRTLCFQPFWMFGAEMGANEHGVVIGNEALFTREKPNRTGLTGMDLIHLALKRGKTAEQARDVIIRLLEQYGQGGKSGYRKNIFYMNSFIIADRQEAYVLEAVGSWWAWKKITDIWSISNIISLQDDFDDCSPDLIKNAVKKGYCKSESDFNFRNCYSARIMTWGAKGRARESCTRTALAKGRGELRVEDCFAILRDHAGKDSYNPAFDTSGTVCMHAADKVIRISQSVCSFVAKIGSSDASYYTTGAANPCMSPFFPVSVKAPSLPASYSPGAESYDEESYWWISERYHREALSCFPQALESVRGRIGVYEAGMLEETVGRESLDQTSLDAWFDRARELVESWGRSLPALQSVSPSWRYKRYWRKYDRINGIAERAAKVQA
jgi:dipeptidase